MKFVDPRNDVAFKKIFGSESKPNVLISFLNAVLGLEGSHRIQSITFVNPSQIPKIEGWKPTELDVLARDENQREFIVEMQAHPHKNFWKRSLYYTAKTYVEQLQVAQTYNRLRPVVFIGILDFELFPYEKFLTKHLILETENHDNHLKDFEFNFIELTKFEKTEEQCTGIIDEWVYFLKNAENLEMIPTNVSADVKEAYEIANQYAWTKEEMRTYEYWWLEELERKDNEEKKFNEGKVEGIEEGMEKGEAKGVEKGKQESLELMIASGISESEARKILNLP